VSDIPALSIYQQLLEIPMAVHKVCMGKSYHAEFLYVCYIFLQNKAVKIIDGLKLIAVIA